MEKQLIQTDRLLPWVKQRCQSRSYFPQWDRPHGGGKSPASAACRCPETWSLPQWPWWGKCRLHNQRIIMTIDSHSYNMKTSSKRCRSVIRHSCIRWARCNLDKKKIAAFPALKIGTLRRTHKRSKHWRSVIRKTPTPTFNKPAVVRVSRCCRRLPFRWQRKARAQGKWQILHLQGQQRWE